MGNKNKGQTWDKFNKASEINMGDYANLMHGPGGYEDFIKSGGYSSDDLANIRARSIAPTRSVYANAERELDRNRALQGGYSPNYAAASAKMAREESQQLSDANQNAEAQMAQMVQQGKLAGLAGATNLYGTHPGLTSTFGNMAASMEGQGGGLGGILGGIGSLGSAFMPLIGKWMGGNKGSSMPGNTLGGGQIPGVYGAGGPWTGAPTLGSSSTGLTNPLGGNPMASGPGTTIGAQGGGFAPGSITSDTIAQSQPIQISKPNGAVGQAYQVAGSNPPLYMDEEYNIYDAQGHFQGTFQDMMKGRG